MSEDKKSGLGLFVKNKSDKAGKAPPSASGASKPKDVKKRWVYVGIVGVGAVIISSSLMGGGDKRVAAPKKAPETMVSVTPPNVNKDEFVNQFGTEVARMDKELKALRAEKELQDKKMAELREQTGTAAIALPGDIVPPPSKGLGNSGGLGSIGSPVIAPPTPPVRVPPASALPASMGAGPLPAVPNGAAPSIPTSYGEPSGPMVFAAPSKSSSTAEASSPTAGGVKAKAQYKKNEHVGMLPAGAFAPIALLNGLDAGTSTTTQSNPMPVLMNLTDQATLPGAGKYKIKSCFGLGTGYGDLSAERVYIRISRLSCVDKANRLVLSQEVAGYLVDSDGKLGMRGQVMDRQGAKLGKAMLAGFAQGLAGALGTAQSSVTSNFSTGTTSSAIGGSAALRASGLSGAQAATSQLADFYLKEAQSIFPVISVDTGRTGTIVFTNSVPLNWQSTDSQFVEEIKPTN